MSEEKARVVLCPHCKKSGLAEFSFCPYCGKPYRAPEPKKTESESEKPKREPKCEKCGGPAKCEYCGDLTKGPDYYNTYRHTCLDPKCGWSKEFDIFAGGAGGGTPFSVCPECGNCPEC